MAFLSVRNASRCAGFAAVTLWLSCQLNENAKLSKKKIGQETEDCSMLRSYLQTLKDQKKTPCDEGCEPDRHDLWKLDQRYLQHCDLVGFPLDCLRLTNQLLNHVSLGPALLEDGTFEPSVRASTLVKTKLAGAVLDDVVANRVEFGESDLAFTFRDGRVWPWDAKVHFRRAQLVEASLYFDQLSSSHSKYLSIRGNPADFRQANLTGADLLLAKLDYADLHQAILTKAKLKLASLRHANLNGASLKGAMLIQTNFSYANLQNADLSWADASSDPNYKDDQRFVGSDLTNANLDHTNLRYANLSQATLIQAFLPSAILHAANLRDANLEGAILTKADLSKADLRNANLRGVVLTEAKLTDAMLDGVKYDHTTVWPDDFDGPNRQRLSPTGEGADR